MENVIRNENLNIINNQRNIDELSKLYLKIIHKYAQIVKELSFKDSTSIDYIQIIKILLTNGIFSLGKLHKEMPYNDDFSKYYYGINIINGYGVCRHITDLVKGILDELNVPNYKYNCYLTNNKHLNPFIEYQANHVANLIDFNDQYFLFDINNDIIGTFKNKKVIQEINDKPIYFYHIPIDNINIYKMNYEEEKKLLNVIKESLRIKNEFARNYDKTVINIDIKYINELMQSKTNLSLINDFLYDTLEDKKEIVKRIGEVIKCK